MLSRDSHVVIVEDTQTSVTIYQSAWRNIRDGLNIEVRLFRFEQLAFTQWRTQEFFSGRVQQIQLRTEDREDGDLGAVAP